MKEKNNTIIKKKKHSKKKLQLNEDTAKNTRIKNIKKKNGTQWCGSRGLKQRKNKIDKFLNKKRYPTSTVRLEYTCLILPNALGIDVWARKVTNVFHDTLIINTAHC